MAAEATWPPRWTAPTPKPVRGSRAKAKRGRQRSLLSKDSKESEKVKARSDGRCEARFRRGRCERWATEIHHMIGGIGKRAVGISALAEHKQHLCRIHHQLVTDNKLIRIGGDVPLFMDLYRWWWA